MGHLALLYGLFSSRYLGVFLVELDNLLGNFFPLLFPTSGGEMQDRLSDSLRLFYTFAAYFCSSVEVV